MGARDALLEFAGAARGVGGEQRAAATAQLAAASYDLARAVLAVAADPAPAEDWLNVGSGDEVTIAELAREIAGAVGYRGRLRFAPDRPEGAPRKLLDSRRLRAKGWAPTIPLAEGLARTARWREGAARELSAA